MYGKLQGPTGLREVLELGWALNHMGGCYARFIGREAGDTGAALVICVD